MIVVSAPELRERATKIFCAADCPEAVSRRVAHSLVEANLTGHDSHGVIRIPWYARAAQSGEIQPRGEIRAIRESATTSLLDWVRAIAF
jgi:LDH2 family malate/lactate/ureidoglycolate dehydrogenase